MKNKKNTKFKQYVILIIVIQLLLTYIYTSSPFSIHCLIRNISLVFSIVFLTPIFFLITEFVLEVIVVMGLKQNIDPPDNKVINCYNQFDIIQSLDPKNLSYYTEGLYKPGQNHKNTSMEQAEQQKFKYICEIYNFNNQTRVLDLGCGNGGFLEYCKNNYGCETMCFTLSPSQISVLEKKDIPCKLINISQDDFPKELYGKYDFIFLNGSAEHFYNRDNSLYYYNENNFNLFWKKFFKKVKNLLDPHSSLKILYFTMIHFRRKPSSIKEHIDNYYLERGFGDTYSKGENGIIKNSFDYFNVIDKQDKTYDYLQYSLSYQKTFAYSMSYPLYLLKSIPYFLTNPYQLQYWLWGFESSWNNQFRKEQNSFGGLITQYSSSPPKIQLWIAFQLK